MILPGIEEQKVYDSTKLSQWSTYLTGTTSWTSLGNSQTSTEMNSMRSSVLTCPSSPMPVTVSRGTARQASSYAAVAGASDTAIPRSPDRCADNDFVGQNCSNGVLHPPERKEGLGKQSYNDGKLEGCDPKRITDGLSKTLMIGEQSAWGIGTDNNRNECRSSSFLGWQSAGNPYNPSWFNMARIQSTRHVGSTTCGSPFTSGMVPAGTSVSNYDNAMPFRSSHALGAQFVYADGAVRWVDASIENLLYRLLAIRDSGQTKAVD